MTELTDLIDRIEESYKLPNCHERCVGFMLDCLSLVRESLPERARKPLEQAERHWSGESVDLVSVKADYWHYLDGVLGKIDKREEAGLRAVVGVLCVEDHGNDIHATLSWFVEFVNQVADKSTELIGLLRKHFPEATEPRAV